MKNFVESSGILVIHPPKAAKHRLTMVEYMKKQRQIILHDRDHRYFTYLAVGHDPSQRDLENHWINGGGADIFASQHRRWLQRKLILIDKEPEQHQQLIDCLTKEGHILAVLPDGSKVREAIKSLGGCHMIIIGPQVAHDDIFSLAAKLHKSYPYLDIILMTDRNFHLAELLKKDGKITNYHILTNPSLLMELQAELEDIFSS